MSINKKRTRNLASKKINLIGKMGSKISREASTKTGRKFSIRQRNNNSKESNEISQKHKNGKNPTNQHF